MRLFKRSFSFVSALVISLSSIFALIVPHAFAVVQTCVWTGAVSNLFSVSGNWTGCGGSTPLDGDIIKFTQLSTDSSTTSRNVTDDLTPGIKFSGVIMDLAQATDDVTDVYTVNGADGLPLAIGGTLTTSGVLGSSFQSGAKINLDTLHAYGDFTVDTENYQIIDYTTSSIGTIDGDLIMTDGYLGGSYPLAGTVTGDVVVTDASLTLDLKLGDFGLIRVGTNAYVSFYEYGSSADEVKTVSSAVSISLEGGAAYWNESSYYDTDYHSVPTTYTMTGDITLTADSSIYSSNDTTVNLNGTITKNSHVLSIGLGSAGNFNVGGTAYHNEAKETTLSDSLPNCGQAGTDGCYNSADNETVTLDGVRGTVSVNNYSTLKGTGTMNDLFVNKGGTVAPGHSPGKLTVLESLTLANGATLKEELQTKDAYDKIQVGSDSVTVGHAVVLGDGGDYDANGPTTVTGNPILETSIYQTGTILKTDTFTIIDNQSKTSVLGTFKDLPEGATFALNGGVMKITYVGGDGNDVVLSVVTVPTVANTGLKLLTSSPIAIIAATLAVTAGAYVLSKRYATAKTK